VPRPVRPRRLSIRAENLRSRATLYDRSPNELTMHFIDWGILAPDTLSPR